jgi:hypothetical protein
MMLPARSEAKTREAVVERLSFPSLSPFGAMACATVSPITTVAPSSIQSSRFSMLHSAAKEPVLADGDAVGLVLLEAEEDADSLGLLGGFDVTDDGERERSGNRGKRRSLIAAGCLRYLLLDLVSGLCFFDSLLIRFLEPSVTAGEERQDEEVEGG